MGLQDFLSGVPSAASFCKVSSDGGCLVPFLPCAQRLKFGHHEFAASNGFNADSVAKARLAAASALINVSSWPSLDFSATSAAFLYTRQ